MQLLTPVFLFCYRTGSNRRIHYYSSSTNTDLHGKALGDQQRDNSRQRNNAANKKMVFFKKTQIFTIISGRCRRGDSSTPTWGRVSALCNPIT